MITLVRQHIPGELRAAGPFSSPSASPSPEDNKGSHWSNVSPTDVTLLNSHDGVLHKQTVEGESAVAAPAAYGEVVDFPYSSQSSIINDDAAGLDERESSSPNAILSDEDGLLITPAEDETDEFAPSSQEASFTSILTSDEIKRGRNLDVASVLALHKSCSQRDKPRLNLFSRGNSDDRGASFLSTIEKELSQFRQFQSTFD